MKTASRSILGIFLLVQLVVTLPAETRLAISCGQTVTEDTILDQDLTCPPGTESAIVIGGSNITLDLGGHLLSGDASGVGVSVVGHEAVTIRNGTIENFARGIFLFDTRNVTIEYLTIRELDDLDPDHLILGTHIEKSQGVIVKDSLFEYPSVFHREAVEVYESDVVVSNIEVRGGGVGVNFSFAGDCDPVNRPSNGTVRDSRFSGHRAMAILVACSSGAWIAGNNISSGLAGLGEGIVGSGPFPGAVTGLVIERNVIYDDHHNGIAFGGVTGSVVSGNIVRDNGKGIAMTPSVGCLSPETGWACFNTTANMITANQAFGNSIDLYHDEDSLGNTWAGNTCETREGADIPECTPPTAVLTINFSSCKPGSFFTLQGANFAINSEATVSVNGTTLGVIPTDPSGDLVFLLSTDQADEGYYLVTVTANVGLSTDFSLDSSRRLCPQEASGTIFDVPGGIARHFEYLPLVRR